MTQSSNLDGKTTQHAAADLDAPSTGHTPFALISNVFYRTGVLPIMLAIALIVFSLLAPKFFGLENLTNLLRQSVYLVLVSLGQMLALVTGGFDLSVGTTVALTSVVSSIVMSAIAASHPEWGYLAIVAGCLAGALSGLVIGLINGLGVARFGVSPFIMTLGMQSVGFGVALFLTNGVPVTGLPDAFGQVFGFGTLLGLPVPVVITLVIFGAFAFMLDRTALGRFFFAVGGNEKAALLSGINTRGVLVCTYAMCALFSSLSGLLMTARVSSGEANIGSSLALESIAACVIAGVSLRGGTGRVGYVVLGAIFIGLVQNGMNLADINSYLQVIVLGALLIVAVLADKVRYRSIRHGN
ncbi:ABC transporter permease [Paraburkholderia sp. J41]|uniref:ABC transporter permease n=1 Tax=Paraburkholderia sp. J41 TaxID=2805433 RepID=UPI002AC31E62|nr:ABC transporter permease [Paraburkholderia sp. J41]